MRRLLELIVPARMGNGFRWLLAADWANQLGDGISLAAGPLLIASQTKNPSLVVMATLLGRAPWLLFGLFAGWVADRYDRRRLVAGADIVRAAVLAGLALAIAADRLSVAAVLVAMFLIGTCEVFADSAFTTLTPMLVAPEDLGIANARTGFGRKAINELIGPPIGAALFVGGLAVPFLAQAVLVLAAAVLVSRITVGRPAEVPASAGVRADVMEGVRWLWNNRPIRTLTLTVVLFNLTFGAMWPILVLYNEQRLGQDEVGFGWLLSAGAVGGMLGAMAYGALERRVALGTLMRAGLLLETFVHLGLGLTTTPWVAMLILFAFGFQASIWGTTASAVRQRAVPENLQGRVGAVYLLGVFGGLVFGNAIGAVIAGIWGVLAPFWFGFVGSAILLAIIWRELPHIVHADQHQR